MEFLGDTTHLLDILGAIIGFISVMLLLSLIVTALVQAAQSIFRLRSRNLRMGLQALLQSELQKRENEARDIANKLLGVPIPKGLLNPARTWIKPEELRDGLAKHVLGITEDQLNKFGAAFDGMSEYLSKRFMLHARLFGLLIGFLVAFIFQVSATGLLRELSTNPEVRAQYVMLGENLALRADTMLTTMPTYQDIADNALAKLGDRHPELAEMFEEASGVGANREDIVREMRMILAERDAAQASAIIEEYEQLLDDMYNEVASKSWDRVQQFTGELATFNIVPWANGWPYYKNMANWLGVLLTAILLTLGAPFWYNRLQEVLSLRDKLKGQSTSK